MTRTLAICIGLLRVAMPADIHAATATGNLTAQVEHLLIELEHDGIESYRFELFEADGSRVYV